MTEQRLLLRINKVRDNATNRIRTVNNNTLEDVLREKLTGLKKKQPVIVYEDEDASRIVLVRQRLKKTHPMMSYTIRGNKIYECRRRLLKNEVIQQTVRQTILVLLDGFGLQGNIDVLQAGVLNRLYNGKEKTKFEI